MTPAPKPDAPKTSQPAQSLDGGTLAMLTDTAIKNAKPKEKPYRLTDEKALYLEVMPNGRKYANFTPYMFGDN